MWKKLAFLWTLSVLCVGCAVAPPPSEFGPEGGPGDEPEADPEVIGYWYQGWEQVTPPQGANMAIAFMGYSDIDEALQDSAKLKSTMVGAKYLSVGGGNEAGAFGMAKLEAITSALQAGKITGYEGIAFDVEECDEEGLASHFAQAFSTAKSKGFDVLVTVSHSEPYGCDDAPELMKAFFDDSNIDYLSPQLYTTGEETQNDYTIKATAWSSYADAKAAIVPSLVRASMYADAQKYFRAQGVTLSGYIQWNNSRP